MPSCRSRPLPTTATRAQRARPVVGLVAVVASLALGAGCASMATTLEKVNTGLAAFADTTAPSGRAGASGAPASRSGATATAVRRRLVLTPARPGVVGRDTAVVPTRGKHRYTIYEIDARAWPQGGVLTASLTPAAGSPVGNAGVTFHLLQENEPLPADGEALGVMGGSPNVRPGQLELASLPFEAGQILRLVAEGGDAWPAGARNVFEYRLAVRPFERPAFALQLRPSGAASESDAFRHVGLYVKPSHLVLHIDDSLAVTTPNATGRAWATKLVAWVAQAERRERAACQGPGIGALQDESTGPKLTPATPTLLVGCSFVGPDAARASAGAGTNARRPSALRVTTEYRLTMMAADGPELIATISAAQLRALANAMIGAVDHPERIGR